MLKIKDYVSLENLENFGFKESDKTWDYWLGVRKIIIYKNDRRISMNAPCVESYDVLYDIINAGYVEKTKCRPPNKSKTTMADLRRENAELKRRIEALENKK